MLALLVPGVGQGGGVTQLIVHVGAPIRAKYGVILAADANSTSVNPPGGLS